MRFEWDRKKALANLLKHRVSFGEATEVFDDPNLVEGLNAEHSDDETCFFVGHSTSRLLLVIFAEREGGVVRIISARTPTPAERKAYEERRR